MGDYGFGGFSAAAYIVVILDFLRESGVSEEVGTLGISLYRLGCIFFIGLERFVDLLRRYVGLGHVLWPH